MTDKNFQRFRENTVYIIDLEEHSFILVIHSYTTYLKRHGPYTHWNNSIFIQQKKYYTNIEVSIASILNYTGLSVNKPTFIFCVLVGL